MRRPVALLCVCFCAGLIGILFADGVEWLWLRAGLDGLKGWPLQPMPTGDGFYPRLLWGGGWGLFFYLGVGVERRRRRWVRKGMLFSLVPALFQLLVLFPFSRQFHLDETLMRLLLLLLLNLVWGAATGIFTRLLWGRG